MKFTKHILALVIAVAALVPLTIQAQTFSSQPFIGYGGSGVDVGANGNLQIVATSTNTYNVNAIYAKGSYFTNQLVAITNAANGLVITGYVSQVVNNLVTNASWSQDANMWANRDGTAPVASIAADINGLNAAFTNIVTFRFAAVPTGAGLACTAAQNLFSFSMTGNGTTDVVIATNLPTGFLQGSRKLRLLAVESSNAGTNGTVANVWFNGFQPAPPL